VKKSPFSARHAPVTQDAEETKKKIPEFRKPIFVVNKIITAASVKLKPAIQTPSTAKRGPNQ